MKDPAFLAVVPLVYKNLVTLSISRTPSIGVDWFVLRVLYLLAVVCEHDFKNKKSICIFPYRLLPRPHCKVVSNCKASALSLVGSNANDILF